MKALLKRAFFEMGWWSVIVISTTQPSSSSVRIWTRIFMPFFQLSIGSFFAAEDSADHWEGTAEEKGPEADDFDEEPEAAIFLGVDATLSIVAHVDHVDNRVDDNAKQSVESRHVPDPSPVHTDADNGQEDGSSDPFNHVEESEHQEWEI